MAKSLIKQIGITTLITITLLLGGFLFFILLDFLYQFMGANTIIMGICFILTWLSVFCFVKSAGVK